MDAPFSCREGNCSACACVVLEGDVTLKHNDVLDADDLADGIRLVCQSLPASEKLKITLQRLSGLPRWLRSERQRASRNHLIGVSMVRSIEQHVDVFTNTSVRRGRVDGDGQCTGSHRADAPRRVVGLAPELVIGFR